jgi:tetratricopeptide (TPR) repeat protein
MMQNNEFLLVDYLDNQLSQDETARVNTLIQGDKQVATEWEFLKMAVNAVELGAIREQVTQARQSFSSQAKPVTGFSGTIVRNMYRSGLRIAAILILVLGISLVYKYSTVNNASVFQQQFTDYSLSTTRGEHTQNALEESFRNKNWTGVTSLFNLESSKTNKTYFLAGMAAMEQKDYTAAVSRFENILAANAKSGENYFQDEAQYYLALAYLMNNQADKGIALLQEIRGNKDHQYYVLARQISSTDLKILAIKSKK